jgi:hypothetical protein
MKYKALAVVSFGAGAVLGLNKDQARARAYVTTAIKGRDGWFTTTSPTQFKAGEEFSYEGDLPTARAARDTPAGGNTPAAAPADKK